MANQYACENEARRLKLQRLPKAVDSLNAIDFLEVLDDHELAGVPRQQILLVHLFQGLAFQQLLPANLALTGGASVRVVVMWAFRASDILGGASLPEIDPGERSALRTRLAALLPPASPPTAAGDALLVIRTDQPGDFSPYLLTLVRARNSAQPPPQFDPQLRSVRFFFKTACASELDCAPAACQPSSSLAPAPELDYLSKDYLGFRQLMLDRLAVVSPELTTQSVADLPVVLVELLAHAADKLSYFQDAVATEAYIGTARRRRSVRRHARLLDYALGEGSNARVFVQLAVSGAATIAAGTQLLTTSVDGAPRLTREQAASAIAAGSPAFESMHPLDAAPSLNRIQFYTWGDDRCCLPVGATRATLLNTGGVLCDATGTLLPGLRGTQNDGTALLALVELRGPESGLAADADPHHRHVVRLTRVSAGEDPLYLEPGSSPPRPQRVVEIEWGLADALPFPLCLWQVLPPGEATAQAVSEAWGNIALADHGASISGEALPPVTAGQERLFRPTLARGPLTWQGQVTDGAGQAVPFDAKAAAAAALSWQSGSATPAIRLLQDESPPWLPKRDLLESDALAQHFVVETEEDGAIELRFGDGTLGRLPSGDLRASYRIGNGVDGNIGADTLAHVVEPEHGPVPPVTGVRNPLPAVGGAAPESSEHARIHAPQSFRVQQCAVTAADYAAAAERHPDVQRAHAVRRFTGSWHTIFIAVDRFGGRSVDDEFKAELLAQLEPLRLAGHDVVVQEARAVPVEIVLSICVQAGFLRADVRRRLLDVFGAGLLLDGSRGFFHPDNFTFGQPLYLSQVLAAAARVVGVASIDTSGASRFVFRRTDQPIASPRPMDRNFDASFGVIHVAPSEVVRVDSDLNRPQNGKITFNLQGGV